MLKVELQSKKQSLWSTFKKAYLRSKNLKKIWKNLDKSNLSKDLVKTFDLYLNSESYNWSSKMWRHSITNHINALSDKPNKDTNWMIAQEYFYFKHFVDSIIENIYKQIDNNKINFGPGLFKKQKNLSHTDSIHHNLILLLLYEVLKKRNVFRYLSKLSELEVMSIINKPYLDIDNKKIVQDDLNSLLEYEEIEKLLNLLKVKNNKFLEIGAGSGRTAKTILSIKNNIKYVIADIPPAINISYENLKKIFPRKKISFAFEINDKKNLQNELEKNDVLFIFPHQIKLFKEKTFDIVLAIDCLHEMEKKIIKIYMSIFQQISNMIYFKVWEHSGLNYSFYEEHSVHNKNDYSINSNWKELLNKRCIYPSKYFELGYQF